MFEQLLILIKINMNGEKLEKKDFDEIEDGISKKIRNRRKKLDKIILTESKIASKEIVPTKEQKDMIKSREKIEAQIQELIEIRTGVRKEIKKVMGKHKSIVKGLEDGESNREHTIQSTLKNIADALLINLLQNEYAVQDLIDEEERVGLESLMVPLKSLFHPPGNEVNYDRARDCFLELFVNLSKGSQDIIPGSHTTYSKLLESMNNIPESVRTSTFKLDGTDQHTQEKEVSNEEEEEKVEVHQEEPAQEAAPQDQEQDWNEVEQQEDEDDDDEEDKEEDEEPEQEENPKKVVKEDNKISKKYVDDDGFTHVKAPGKSYAEKQSLRGRGRRGGGRDKRERQRQNAKVDRGGKNFRGHGKGRGRHPHDKFGTDETTGRKSKAAHGKNPHWHKGEVRVEGQKE